MMRLSLIFAKVVGLAFSWTLLAPCLHAQLVIPVQSGNAEVETWPSDVKLEFKTATGSNRFQIGEVIPLEVRFSSDSAGRYLEPCNIFQDPDQSSTPCRFYGGWSLKMSPGIGFVDLKSDVPIAQLIYRTHDAPGKDLTHRPVTYSTVLTSRYRFQRPGTYKVRFTTKLGLDDETTRPHSSAEPFISPHYATIVRDLLLEIVPASPDWERGVIRRGVAAASRLELPKAKAGNLDDARYQRDLDAFCMLDSSDALRAMAALLAEGHRAAAPCLQHTLHVPVAIAEMRREMVQPAAGMNLLFFDTLTSLLDLQKDGSRDPGKQPENVQSEVREELLQALPNKTGEAYAETLVVLMERRPAPPEQLDPLFDKPIFRDAVIAFAARNFGSIPAARRKMLLEADWPAVRSPLLLDAVRREARAGNGQGLLRWQELDPAGAIAFERDEVVRSRPRFSSYYLRLPDTSLPLQEAQIARNFVALRDTEELRRSAMLLHRYATRSVLPVVLPFLDEHLMGWRCEVLFPTLAYLLKVAPEEAEPRIRQARGDGGEPKANCGGLLYRLGSIKPSPVLERIAVDTMNIRHRPEDGASGYDVARIFDALMYVRSYGSPAMKPVVWGWLLRWQKEFVDVPAGKWDESSVDPQLERRGERDALLGVYGNAHAWVLTPEEVERLKSVADLNPANSRICLPSYIIPCSEAIGPEPDTFVIRLYPANLRLTAYEEVFTSLEGLAYEVRQYSCPDMQSLKDKILQLPKGSTFEFSPQRMDATWLVEDPYRREVIEIIAFLKARGYKVHVPANWTFVQGNVAMVQAPLK